MAGVAWVVVQVAVPLRHHLYPGDARWTNEGYRFSWNVLAAERSGDVEFRLTDPATGRTWVDDAAALYTSEQWHLMATEPDLIHQAALELARRARAEGHDRVEVRADAFVSLNGRPAARLVDPTVDLAAQPRDLWHDGWILPAPTGPRARAVSSASHAPPGTEARNPPVASGFLASLRGERVLTVRETVRPRPGPGADPAVA